MNSPDGSTAGTGRRWCVLALAAGLMTLAGCGGNRAGSSSNSGGAVQVDNIQPIQVNAGPTGNDVNQLLTSVTVCDPGTTNCQTISDVQVDTGSEGLRILSSQIRLSLPQVKAASGNPIGNCVTFADNSYVWGPVVTADVQLSGEKASSVPIEIIGDPNFVSVPSACNSGGTALNTVAALGANGILGVGVFRQDCGTACSGNVSSVPKVYFSCASSGCSVTSVPVANQLQNPVWLFSQDNNGLLISLPSVSATGAANASGSMIFGIGTETNNALGNALVYTTNAQGDFTTTFKGVSYKSSFIDTGSNGLFFLDSSTVGIPVCSSGNSHFYCPSSTVNYTATNAGVNATSEQVSFSIANAVSLFKAGNTAFINLGGTNPGAFDWGLPFFFGRNVFVGIEGQSAPAGVGPFWAY